MTTALLGDRIVIGNRADELRRMTQWLRESAAALDIPQDLVFQLDVCANEAVYNIISYAYADAGHHEISLELTRTAQGARLVICDDGRPFDPLAAPAHAVAGGLEDAEVGGLGIHLMRSMMARCDYRRAGGINVLSLEARRHHQPGDA